MKRNTNIKEGYKKTAVGVIPEDWEVKRLGEIGEPKMCKRIFKNQTTTDGDIPFFKIGTFGKTPDSFINVELFEEYRSKYSFPVKGDILISAAGTIGRLVVYDGEPAYFQDSNIVWINNDEEIISNKLLYFIYSIIRWQKTEGGIISRLYNSDLRKVKLPIPPLPEQQAIANCLTTWDSGIEKLTQLIAAKREQKKGLMQQLLTGKKRLDGFVGEWEEVKIKEMGRVSTGNTPSKLDKNNWGDDFPWVTAEDMDKKYIFNTEQKLSSTGKEKARIAPKGSLMITCIASIGKNSIIAVDSGFNQQINAITVNSKHNNEFLFYLIDCQTYKLIKYASPGALKILNKNTFENIKYKLPSLEEQTAIAHILTTADQEISLLEEKLATMKEEKKGLMQVLLTGKKRLIDS